MPTDAEPVRAIQGDCRDVLSELVGHIDATITDPPYGIGANPATRRPSNYQRLAGMKPRMWDMEAPDLTDILNVGGVCVVWGGNYFALPPSRGWLVWFKPDAVPSMSSVELAWTNRDANSRQLSYSIAATNAERIGHPTQKPVRVMRWTIQQLKLPPNSLILDPFGGSGTTAIAALREGHRCIIIEKEPAYVEIIRRRVREAMGTGLLAGIS